MLSFITFRNSPEAVEVLLDDQGIDELIQYLEFVKRSRDDIDLIEGNELDKYSTAVGMEQVVCSVKHVRLIHNYRDSSVSTE